MSAAALALLQDGTDDSPPEESPAKRAISLLEGKSQPGAKVPRADLGDISSDPDVGAAEAVLKGVTGGIGSAVGGIAGVGSLLLGRGNDSAADTVDWWKQALTYEPRTTAGQGAADVGGRVASTVMAPLQTVKEYAGDSAEAAGWGPLASTLMSVAPDAILATLGAPGAPTGAGASLLGDARAVAEATAPARNAVGRAFARDDVAPAAEAGDTMNPLARESLGAAAAVPSQLMTASPELQAAVRAEARAGSVDRAALDRHLEADSLPIPMRLTEGQATQNVEQLSHELNRRGKDPELAQRFNEQNQQLIDNLDEIRREAAPNVVGNDHIQNGQTLIDSYKSYDEQVRADIAAKYQALRDANGGDFPVDGPAFVAEADKALKKNFKARYVPPQVAADLEAIRSGEVSMNFEQFENLRTNLAAEARKAERSGDGNAAAAVNIVRESLESLPMTGDAAGLKPLADEARKAAKARFDRLRADPAYKAAVDDPVEVGQASALADDFIQKYVVKGRASNIDRMRETLSADPTASETIAAGALNYLKSKSGINLYTNEGNFSQAGYNRALSELTPKLEALVGPQRAEQVQTLGNVARYTQMQPRGSFVNNSNTLVAAAAEGVKSSIEGAANVAAGGVPVGTWTRKALEKRADKKFVQEALKPGAGLKPKPKP